MKSYRFLFLGLMLSSAIARASIIPTTPTVTPAGPDYTWTYSINLQTGEGLSSTIPPATGGNPSGDYFTIYDVVGYVFGSAAEPAGWTSTVQLTGVTPPTQSGIPDNPAVANITFFYIGAPTIIGTGQTIGTFSFESLYSQPQLGVFTAETLNTATGGVDQENGPIMTPFVPEPGSVSLVLAGVVLLGTLVTRRRRLPL